MSYLLRHSIISVYLSVYTLNEVSIHVSYIMSPHLMYLSLDGTVLYYCFKFIVLMYWMCSVFFCVYYWNILCDSVFELLYKKAVLNDAG